MPPALLVLRSDISPLSTGPINNEEASWLGSSKYIGCFCGNFLFLAIFRYFGRKKTFCVMALPNLVS